jgi:mannose-1-phosphate guanylyltransferase
MDKHFYAVIMAGGSGSRLWPMSRQASPKQFQKLVGDKTLIQETYERVKKVVPTGQIYVATIERYKDLVTEQLPEVPSERIFLEPATRNTAPAFGLIAYKLHQKDPQAIVATVASDHVVKNSSEFVKTFKVAFEIVAQNNGYLGTVGINPDKPDTNYGYIKMGDEHSAVAGKKVFKVEAFVEKPDLKTATVYLKSWQYLWNASYFFWRVKDMITWLEKYQAKTARGLKKIVALDAEEDGNAIAKLYRSFDSEPIDTAVVEKLDKILVIPADLGWSDVGNWGTLYDVLSSNFESQVISKGHHIDHDSKNILVYAQDKMIATVGLKDIMIIDTQDAILVIDKHRAADVKKLLDRIKVDGKHLYL